MENSNEKNKKFINNYLNKMLKGYVPRVNFDFLLKKGLSKKEINEYLVDYALTNDLPMSYDNTALFFDSSRLAELLKYDDTKEKVVKLLKKYRANINLNAEILGILIHSDLDLYFFISLESFYDFTNFSNNGFKDILNEMTAAKKWNESHIKKFFIYFFNNPAYVNEFGGQIYQSFQFMGETLQRFLVMKTDFIERLSMAYVRQLLSMGTISETLGEIIIKKYNWGDDDIYDIVNFYLNVDEKYQKFIFPNERDFNVWLGGSEELYDVLSAIENQLTPTQVETFFKYNPNWVDRIDHEEGKVKLKYGIKGVPDFVKNSIELEMVEQAKFDGEEIEKMFYDNRDSPSVWVKYYVDDELWDHTINWDYNPDESTIRNEYWKYLTKDNFNKIIEILKKENPKINVGDEDEVKDAAFENDEIGSVLRSAASDGERQGDERELIKDIESGIDQLFGKGNWEKIDGKILAKIDISNIDNYALYDAYNECGEWHIKCIFTTVHGEYISNQYRPSLPEYRYGIQGDFDDLSFNDYIEGNL